MSRITSRNIFASFLLNYHFRFFHSLDWEDVYYKQLKPPIVPEVNSKADTKNFTDYQENEVPEVSDRQGGLFVDF